MFINRKGQVTRRMHVVMKASWNPENGLLDDWMFLMNDQILLNRAEMFKFGIKVGEINIVFIKRK